MLTQMYKGGEEPVVTEAMQKTKAPVMPADEMAGRAADAAAFLKALSHEGRLMILCHLSSSEKSVTALEELIGVRQAAVSQHLARLRSEGLVDARRDGKTIYYTIKDPKVRAMIALVYEMFCGAPR